MAAEADLESEIFTAYETSAAAGEETDADPVAIMEQLAADMTAAIVKYVEAMLEEHTDDEHE